MSNYRNNHNSPKLYDIHSEVKNARENLPYTFVPVEGYKRVENSAKFNVTDMEGEKLYSGHLNCSLHALNYLLVGNEHGRPEDEKDNGALHSTHSGNNQTLIKPLIVKENIFISPYTLKGCLSNFLSAFLEIPMREDRINPQRFLFRPNINFKPTKKIKLGIGIVLLPQEECVRFSHLTELGAKTPVIYGMKEKGDKYSELLDDCFHRNPLKKQGKHKIARGGGKEMDLLCFRYTNGLDGEASFARLFADKSSVIKQHNCIYIDNSVVKFKGNQFLIEKPYELFKKTYSILQKEHLQNHPLLGKDEANSQKIKKNIERLSTLRRGDLIFYEYEEKNQNGKTCIDVKTFGKTYYYPWCYDRGIHDFSRDIRKIGSDRISPIEEMFGYSFEEDKKNISKSGKVHFNFAKYCGGGKIHKDYFVLPRPGEPKPSSYEFYLRQNPDKREPACLNSYGEVLRNGENSRLSGRKFYHASTHMPNSINPNTSKQIENQYAVLLKSMLKPDGDSLPEFKFRINFENLTETELRLLVFSLKLDNLKRDDYLHNKSQLLCHQIGYGKNYGMGAVKFQIENKSKIYHGKNLIELPLSDFIDEKLFEAIKNKKDLCDAVRLHNKGFHYPKACSIKGNREYQVTGLYNKPKEENIPNWHTNIRKVELENRRK
jgi:CRISPR-associated protein (TIGR03986 family)